MANNFDETNTFLDPEPLDLENISKDTVLEHLESKKPGRKKNAVWNYFIEDETRKAGHSSSTCVYCGDTRDRGRVPDLMAHLALQCESVESSVKEQYLKILAESCDQFSEKSTTKKRKFNELNEEIAAGIQPKITSKLQKSTIDPGQRILCNKSLTRLFVCCGFPFAAVESPFFIDYSKNLCAGYQPPDRKTLSGSWLDNETARITVDVEGILKKQENLSLGKSFFKCLLFYAVSLVLITIIYD
jgi:hypothetical protein